MEILIATQNAGKITELENLLKDLPIILRNLKELKNIVEPAETGADFVENAILKAKYYAAQTGLPAIADDSGLEVAALNGAPGIFSARYAGADADDAARNKKLLAELEKTAVLNRTARFVCAVAFAGETGETIYTAQGICNGKIARAPSGGNGFGYDSIFIPDGFLETFGELSSVEKQKISHRGRAMRKLIAFLRDYYTA